jgi:hypothetical protein
VAGFALLLSGSKIEEKRNIKEKHVLFEFMNNKSSLKRRNWRNPIPTIQNHLF